MAEKDYSLDDSPRTMNNADIGKKRMSCIFILRAGDSPRERSQELYDGIYKENDKEFVQWFNEIKHSLSRTANKNNGKHQEILEIFLKLLQDTSQYSSSTSSPQFMSCKPKNVAPLKQFNNIKIILLGRLGSGKTRFLCCAAGGPIKETISTVGYFYLTIVWIGVDLRILECQYQGKPVRITLWDTGGQERFEAITQSYYRGANGALIFVDLSRFKSPVDRRHVLQSTKKLIQDLEENMGIKLPCLLVGAKYDLVNELSPEEQNAFTQLADFCTNSQWIITSAHTGFNVENAVHMIVEWVMNKTSHNQDQPEKAAAVYNNTPDGDTVRLSDNSQPSNHKQRKMCCT